MHATYVVIVFSLLLWFILYESGRQQRTMGMFSKSEGAKGKGNPSANSPLRQSDNGSQFLYSDSASPAAQSMAKYYSAKAATSAALQAELESTKRAAQLQREASGRQRQGRLCSPGRLWMHILTACQIGVALGLIGVVVGCLTEHEQTKVTPEEEDSPPVSTTVCYATTRSFNACQYSIWASALSIVFSVTISLMNICCPRRRYALCLSLESLLGLIGTGWWIAAGVTGVVLAGEATELPKDDCRMAAWILCFANAVFFGLSFLTSTAGCCITCCGMREDDDQLV
jgi:hypothetical protein